MRSLGRAGLVLAGVLVSALVLEAGLTLWHGSGAGAGPWEPVPEAGSPFVFRLHAAGTEDAPGVGIIPARSISSRTPDGTRRVLSYGDSIAAGHGIDVRRSYTALLDERLSTADKRPTQVLNMVRGHSPSIYAQHLRHDVERLSPDAVLVEIELVNDLADEAHVSNGPIADDGLPSHLVRGRYLVGFDGHLLAPLAWRGWVFERTQLFTILTHGFGRMLERIRPNPIFADASTETYYARRFDRHRLDHEALDAAFVRLFDSLAAMHEHLARQGVTMAVLVIPSQYVFEDGAFRAHGRSLLDRAMRELERRRIPALSLEGAITAAGGAAAYLDFCHPTEAGHAAVAGAVADALSQGILGDAIQEPRPGA